MKAWQFWRQYRFARHHRFTTRDALEQYQRAQLVPFIRWVRANSPFYTELWEGLSDEAWQQFPLIDKQQMMESFTTLNTVGIEREAALQVALQAETTRDFSSTLNGITIGLSSGTSGQRGLFIVSAEEQAKWAGMILGRLLPRSLFAFWQKETIAFFLRANSNLYESVNRLNIAFHFFDLMGEFADHVARLEAVQPSVLIAPASLLRQLVDANVNIQPRKVISVAEVLEPFDRAKIEAYFGQVVHQVYQCTEGFLASSCEHGTLHLHETHVHIEPEYIDEAKTQFVPIITDFTRTSQPIVRYRLNDVLVKRQTPCPCGRVELALDAIAGRCDDLMYGVRRGTADVKVIYPDFIRRLFMQMSEPIAHYRVEQVALDEFIVEMDVTGNKREAEAQLRAQWQTMMALLDVEMPTVLVRFAVTEQAKGAKLRRLVRTFTLDEVVR